MTKLIALLGLVALLLVLFLPRGYAQLAASWQRAAMEREIRVKFPHVARMSTAELDAWLRDSHRQRPLLLDVRTAEEFKVSRLSGALRADPDGPVDEAVLARDKKTPIVTYCSVGYRSADFAEKLQKAGFGDVHNLDGSLFKWANENRPMVDDHGQPTIKVHPFNAMWGRLLDPVHR